MDKLRDGFIHILRYFWLLCGLFFWAYWFVSIPSFLNKAANGTLPTTPVEGLIPFEEAFNGAAAWGTSIQVWAWINLLANGLVFLTFSLIGLFIWWRVRTGFGLLTAYVLLLAGSSFMNMVLYSTQLSTLALNLWLTGAVIWPLFFLWIYLFPNGKPSPRLLLYILIPLLVIFLTLFLVNLVSGFFPNNLKLNEFVVVVEPYYFSLIIPLFFIVTAGQIYRYARISNAAERKQTKWFLFGLLIFFFPSLLLENIIQYPAELDTITFIALPIGIGISILRYRLWDIDFIIRKTLVYGILTTALAIVYFTTIILFQNLVGQTRAEQSPLVIVFSTLLIAALFNPLRRRIQNFIDRRFYRRKYDAAQTLAQFAQTVRDEVDVERLSAVLVNVVEETMQPQQATVWFKETKESKRP